ncbi:translation initiation factor eIF2 assembly protein-like [Artemia franciscana]|uniref:Cell division cycle protein 123 homolog n=1 Tax=Artemia franciscana TaxID=6661 RepID=A0AA88I6F3_ARTSF|nr:hypothetical protein QYM36_003429 [Artemia franciscana]KAK2721150.1 hypothetical protein QYM36_003429 [Artemia franciscana]KAK2721151.1 hypothetical protein QYM36_003429 [Artemia franciscana]
MKSEDVLMCSISKWYKQFKKNTFQTYFVKLCPDFIDYLNEDCVLIPDFEEVPSLPLFHQQMYLEIKEGLRKLCNVSFIKLNWSAPTDARWLLLNQNMQCTSVEDVYLLLKSSDRTAHDLSQPFKDCLSPISISDVEYVLALRKWEDICSSWEFRCFVRDRHLVGISQRDISASWPYLRQEEETIVSSIVSFFKEKIQNFFPLTNFVFDVVRYNKEKIKIVDFNPFGITTDGLLFTWEELSESENLDVMPQDISVVANYFCWTNGEDGSVVFRYLKDSARIQSTSHRLNCYPIDMVLNPKDFAKSANISTELKDSDDEDGEGERDHFKNSDVCS